jgi:GTP-binding protein
LKDPKGKHLPEIAFVGRSNVGKSSLINHLLKQRNLAKTSSTPGKTQLLNFYLVDEKLLLVDLPGYGYAKAPTKKIENWSQSIDAYLNSRSTLRLILILLDSRRDLSNEDFSMIHWAKSNNLAFLVLLTKTDKLSPVEMQSQVAKTRQILQCEVIPYTIKTNAAQKFLEKRIKRFL